MPPSDNAFTFNAPNQKRGLSNHPNTTQDDPDNETVETAPTDTDKEEEEMMRLPQLLR